MFNRLYKAEYGMLFVLGEDELVGITERPTLCGYRPFNRAVTRALVLGHARHPSLGRSALMREAMKRIRRLAGIMAFETLDELTLERVFEEIFDETATAMQAP